MAAVFQTEMTAAVFQTETSAAALFSTDGLKEAAVFEIVLYDYIGDGVKHELDIRGVRSASKVCVDLLEVPLLVPAPVKGLELELNICCSILVCVGTLVFGEANI